MCARPCHCVRCWMSYIFLGVSVSVLCLQAYLLLRGVSLVSVLVCVVCACMSVLQCLSLGWHHCVYACVSPFCVFYVSVTVSSVTMFNHCVSTLTNTFVCDCVQMSITVCVCHRLLQCVCYWFCGSIYVSITLGLPISVPVCHCVCPCMCHHLPRCHRECYSPPRPQVGVSGPLVPGLRPSPSHPRLPWDRLGACLQCLPQVNIKIRNPRATSLTSTPWPSACPELGWTRAPQAVPPNWRCALTLSHPWSPASLSLQCRPSPVCFFPSVLWVSAGLSDSLSLLPLTWVLLCLFFSLK